MGNMYNIKVPPNRPDIEEMLAGWNEACVEEDKANKARFEADLKAAHTRDWPLQFYKDQLARGITYGAYKPDR